MDPSPSLSDDSLRISGGRTGSANGDEDAFKLDDLLQALVCGQDISNPQKYMSQLDNLMSMMCVSSSVIARIAT